MSVTIKDIAKKMGISATAVSKALNDRNDVSEELKRKVHKVAGELNYSPNSIAKRLVTNKSNTIGVFMLSRSEDSLKETTFGSGFIGGILEEANKNGYDIVLFSTDSDLLNKKSYLELCKERRVEGAVFTGLRLDDPHIDELQDALFPISIIDTEVKGKNLCYVSTDNKTGVNLALEYLWNLGHRRIAMVNGHSFAQVSRVRYKTYKSFLKGKGVFDENLVFTGDYTKTSGYNCGMKIAELSQRPTAIFAASDLMAFGVIEAMREKDINLPAEMSIVGYDNVSICEYIQPKLTTVGQDSFQMGREAVKMILQRLEGVDVKRKILQPELIIRESCAVNHN